MARLTTAAVGVAVLLASTVAGLRTPHARAVSAARAQRCAALVRPASIADAGSDGMRRRPHDAMNAWQLWKHQLPKGASQGAAQAAAKSYLRSDASVDACQTKCCDSESSQAKADGVHFVAECELPTRFGMFRLRGYRSGNDEPTVLLVGDVSGSDVIVRVHDQCFTSEVMGSERCDCREQLDMAMQYIADAGNGIIIYLQQEGRGIGLANKIAAYALQDKGFDTVQANRELGFPDENRDYSQVPAILNDLGIKSVKLLTNNPFKLDTLRSLGVQINERLPLLVIPRESNRGYLQTKARRMAHLLPDDMLASTVDAGAMAIEGGTTTDAAADASVGELFNPQTGKTHKWCMGRESVLQTIEAIGRGEPVVVTDDEDRENEGDLIMAAELATPETIGFFVRWTSGVLCVAMESDRLEELRLPQMVPNNEDPKNTAFTLTVDAKHGVSTGISAGDRAITLRGLASPASTADDFCRPGHIFPLRAKPGGVLERDGHTEASVDLCKLAGLSGAGVLCEIVTADSISMARMPELVQFARDQELAMTTIEDMICFRLETEAAAAA